MPYKIVGADENSDFPPRVETRLASKFTNKAYADSQSAAALSASKTYTDQQIDSLEAVQIVEDVTDPGFFVVKGS